MSFCGSKEKFKEYKHCMVASLFNKVFMEGQISEDWRKSFII